MRTLQRVLWSLNHYLCLMERRMCEDNSWGEMPYQLMNRVQGTVWSLADRAGYDIYDA